MRKILVLIFVILISGCAPTSTPGITPTPVTLAELPAGCTAPGTVTSADLPQPRRGYAYSFRVYLPPCYAKESIARYPVLYLIPGRSSSPDSWFKAGLPEEMDRLILGGEIPPMIVVSTENTDSDPMAETIHNELIPYVASQYPIAADRRYRAVAGGSLGGSAASRLAFQYPDTFFSAGIFGAGVVSGEEPQIRLWLSRMDDANRTRVFMNSGTQDPLMLERARAMKPILDEAGVENEIYVDESGHHYKYWVPNFEMYLKWLAKDW